MTPLCKKKTDLLRDKTITCSASEKPNSIRHCHLQTLHINLVMRGKSSLLKLEIQKNKPFSLDHHVLNYLKANKN